jgi:N-acetylneuraminic acid mutarotase
MYVLGGVLGGIHFSASVFKFDSTQGTWSEVAPMPEERFAHIACVLGSNIYVFGGCDNFLVQRDSVFMYDVVAKDSVFMYDVVANSWTTLAPMPTVGVCPGVTTLDDQIYLTGMGDNGKDVLLFDTTSGVWSSLAPTIHGRRQGALFVLGGCMHVAGEIEIYASVERYDAGTNTWTAVAYMREGRRSHVTVTIPGAGLAEEQNLSDVLIAKANQ